LGPDGAASDLDHLRAAFAISKALLLRNSTAFSAVLQQLLEALKNADIGLVVARGFGTLLQPDELLTKENYCVVSPLHKQKLFNLVIQDFIPAFKSADRVSKKNHLVALSGIIHHLPFEVIEPQLEALTPLLLQLLDLVGESHVKAPAVDTMVAVLTHDAKPLEQHVTSLISRLLSATSAKSNPAIVRARALYCLTLTSSCMKRETIIPFRRQVIKKLTEALDDKRRSVRVEAVACRKKWIELDDGADDDD
jgi:DNA repair/transcription protein MET18/MMS19